MEKIEQLNKISDYNDLLGVETLHPLVSVIDFSKCKPVNHGSLNFGFYAIFLKDVKCGDIKYGKEYYDYQEGTLVFFAPGQIMKIENNGIKVIPKGFALLFHPDLLNRTSLAKEMNNFSFFSYDAHEALHISTRERKVVLECLEKIEDEIGQRIDKHSSKLVVSNIELFLNYCTRFYDRQFITRDTINRGILEKFEILLNNYLYSDLLQKEGHPKVNYFAEELHLSANYFGDLVKKETGKSAQEYIHLKLMKLSKEKIFDNSKTINEIAYELGFKYPQHFSRMFKKETGFTPNEYRNLN
ncbi:AraC family transcriptional regulator [Apibacter muscae]|uniref:helix-turn-helix domain-containing protein n=1 Tax=Apibacter muscae TaxID=2509004 RepID=UPI0011ABBCA1|nr:helix-turn-helix domain-containing protein [Apibacter muscae]TWP28090.1 AraC family transcriptional regulator [Apibacter muscae]